MDPVTNPSQKLVALVLRGLHIDQSFVAVVGSFLDSIRVLWTAQNPFHQKTLPISLVTINIVLRERIPDRKHGVIVDYVPIRRVRLQKDLENAYWTPDGISAELMARWGGDKRTEGWQGYEVTATCNGVQCICLPPFSVIDPAFVERETQPLGFRVIAQVSNVKVLTINATVVGYMNVVTPITFHNPNGSTAVVPTFSDYMYQRVKEGDWTVRLIADANDLYGSVGFSILPYKEISPLLTAPTQLRAITQSASAINTGTD